MHEHDSGYSTGVAVDARDVCGVAELEKLGRCSVDLTHDSRADLVSEFKKWLSITATSQEGRGSARGTSQPP